MCQCCSHRETSQLIWCANQLIGFYMRKKLNALNGLMEFPSAFLIFFSPCLVSYLITGN